MKFILAISLFTVLTSAASIHPTESSSNEVTPPNALNSAEATVENLNSGEPNLSDLLNRIKTEVSRGIAGAETGDSTDPFDALFKKDFSKFFPNRQLTDESQIAQLKEMFVTNEDFKNILDSDIYDKLFDEKLVKSLFKGENDQLNGEESQAAHAKIDETFSNILNVPTDLIRKNREKAMKHLKTISDEKGDNFSWSDLFGKEFGYFMSTEL